jgi:predicted NACHT family NTPase
VVEADSPDVEPRTLLQTLEALRAAVGDPKGSVVLTPAQITELVQHQPRDLAEYRLARIAEWSQKRYRIDRRFVNLTLLIDQGEDAQGARWAATESRRFTDLRDVVKERRDDPALVLLGAPGSGKSTLLRRFQLDTAMDTLRDGEDRVTFFVSLNSYKIDSGRPRGWLNVEWMGRYPDLPGLDALLAGGKVVLLLDAVNEMPHRGPADYHERVGLWRDFIQSIVPKGNRALFSCRSLDYSTR